MRRGKQRSAVSNLIGWFVSGVVCALFAAFGAFVGWFVALMIGGGAIWLVDMALPDPNGAWAWWEQWIDWFQRGGAVIGGAIFLGYIAQHAADWDREIPKEV